MTDNKPEKTDEAVVDPLNVKPEVQRAPQTAPGTELAEQQDEVEEKLGQNIPDPH